MEKHHCKEEIEAEKDRTSHKNRSATMTEREPAPKVMGDDMDLDELQLQAQGHVSELPRHFSTMSLLAFAFAIMNSWIGFVSLLLTTLTMGGPTTAFWAPIVGCVASAITATGLAELASAFPSSGGQYHYTYMTASAKLRNVLAFSTGWISILAYLFTTSSGAIFTAQSIAGLAHTYHPDFEVQRWHIWLIYAALIIVATTIVTALPALVPKTQSIFFWASVTGITVISITVLSTSPTKRPAKEILASWNNESGWNSGLTFMLAVGQSMWSFTCVDSATHVAEEIPRPAYHVPRAMLLAILIGFLTNTFFSAAVLFSSTDFLAIAEAEVPMYEAYNQAMDSRGGAAFFTVWLIFIYFGALLGLVTTTGRLIWAFSRDNGMPFSGTFLKINKHLKVPLEANLLTGVFCILYGIIYIGSSVAFNTFISTAILFLNLSYTIPQAVVAFSDRDKVLPNRQLRLPKVVGMFCNLFSVAWVALYTVLFCFPLSLPASAESMNYVSVVVAASFLLIVGLWFISGKRNSFRGPDINIEVIDAVNAASGGTASAAHERINKV